MISIRLAAMRSLARRYPFCALCAVLSAVLVVVSALLGHYLGTFTLLQHKKQLEGESVLATMFSGPQLRQELAFVREATQRISENLVTETDLSGNMGYFFQMGDQTKASIDVHPLNVPPPDPLSTVKRVPFNLRVTGTYTQVATYVHAVETGPRLANITYFKISRVKAGSATIALELNVDLLGTK